MAALAVATVTNVGVSAATPTQLSAWGTPDTIDGSALGDRGVIVEVSNTSGGSLDLRISDPGSTPAGNAPANPYRTVTVANSGKFRTLVTQANVLSTGVAQVGASTTNAAFTVTVYRA